MRINKTSIPGCFEMLSTVHSDPRGLLVKTFHLDYFVRNGLETKFAEEFYSFSHRGVLRGLHFQIPPRQHTKLVYCILGEVFDAVVDLRINSPAYGKYESFVLSDKVRNMIYIPPGCAHGFYVMSAQAILIYKTTAVYSQEHDSGIRWDSAGINWPDNHPLISERDKAFAALADFNSPFT